MTKPMTDIDTRFSDPGSAAAEWDETRRAIEAAELFWISTVRADGRPHVTPLVAVWLDGAIHFFTRPGGQKAMNLRNNPAGGLPTRCNESKHGRDLTNARTTTQAPH